MHPYIQVRLACESDLPELTAISEAADSAAHWTAQQWRDIFHSQSPARLAWIAEDSSKSEAMGFLVAQNGGPEWELENIAVQPEFRAKGIGRKLLSALLERARSSKAERIVLEVRASNLSAIRLYSSSGFEQIGRRRDYYRNPEEDALIWVHTF